MKLLFDILFSLLGLAVFSPFMAALALLIKREDGGPVFYRGRRVGRHGRTFRIFKFRTMIVDAEKLGGASTPNNDPRITNIGEFLRKYKLDELPQLINVLKGDMSIVGPRPEVQRYVNMFSDEEKTILTVRPGITDWASLWNIDEGSILAGSQDPERAYMEKIRPRKLELQLKYVKERSLMTDVKIIVLTLKNIVFPKNRYVEIS
jgi:lipopolysaccharide/colanic/teichoic acid biosynthesis glycosyltransferase